jgi:hypothetical protein
MRAFVGICAILTAIFLVRGVVTRRWQLGGSIITPSSDPKIYWLLTARHACTLLGLALLATIVPEKLSAAVIVLVVFAPTVAFALLTGRFEWEADNKRIDSPRRFWGWVAFYALLCMLMGTYLLIELFSARAP